MEPLEGVRVVDVTSGPGRTAGHLLAGLGADVVRVGHGDPGPPLADSGGLLEWWFDSGTRRSTLDLDDQSDRDDLRRLAAACDLLIDDEAPGALAARGLGPADLAETNPALVQVSVTPFGSRGPRAGWRSSDLVAQAMGGWLSVTGDPDRPVALWGRQAHNVAGMYAAIEGLAGVLSARRTGTGCWVDLSMHRAVVSCTEHLLMYWWYPEALAPYGAPIAGRQRSLHWIRAFEVVPCRRGHCMVSPAAGGLLGLIAWLHERGHALDVPAEPDRAQLVTLIEPMMSALRAVALTEDATDLFRAGQALRVPFGEAYSVPQVAACEQHEARDFFRPVADQPTIRLPGPLGRFSATPAATPTGPPAAETAVDEVLAGWPPRTGPPGAAAGGDRSAVHDLPLAGIRVLDFTHVLAGPFGTRIMADLGADVIRVQTTERNVGTGANDFPYNVLWARNKRSVHLEMHHERARDVVKTMVEQADVVVDNFSAGVLDRWGVGADRLHDWNPAVVTMSMSGCGADGPWQDFVTYAPTVHALSGFTALTGPVGDDGCGPGTAHNDHVSGLIEATLLLAALRHRDATGQGQHVDASQLEIGTWLAGPAIVEYLATGREAVSRGNRDPWREHVVNDAFQCADGEWLAVTVDDDHDRDALAEVVRAAAGATTAGEVSGAVAAWAATVAGTAAVDALQGAGIAAGLVQTARHLVEEDPQLAFDDWLVDLDSAMQDSQQTDRHPARWYVDGTEVELSYRPSPYLGEHDFEVYGELLGWDEAAVAEAIGDGLFT